MKRAFALLAFLPGACDNSSVAVAGWPFDPVQFFAGHTRGDATLRLVTGGRRHVSVDSHGTPDGHGGLVLDQTISEQGSKTRTRRWILHPDGANHWSGTLTDAAGDVQVERTPTDVVIRYRMKNGAHGEQHLQQPPGGAVLNHMTVARFGIRLATLDERITSGA